MANDTSKNNKKKSQQETTGKFLIVGLGASAGGIHALKEFFTQVPEDSGIAYVVILHMSPEHESKLAEILQSASSIPVTQVRKRVKVVPDRVYVIPPNQNLAMSDGHLALTNMIGSEERRSPVDLFFRTLAEANENRGVSVILSGTGANGSMGMKRIKEYGGVAFVQDPTEAEYDDMPRNAIATGMADYVLPVAEIPGKIISYKAHIGKVQTPEVAEQIPKTSEQALLDIFTQLRVRTGHDFSNYKRATIMRRLERRVGLRELHGLPEYVRFLREQPMEVHALMKDLLISVTNFFRDPESLDALKHQVMNKIVEGKGPDDPIRVWVPGCATGEEAYSIAMLFSECVTYESGVPNLQLFATDLDQDAIQIAREGYYKDAEMADVSPERLRMFFTREADAYRVRRELRDSILFAVHNVIKDPPFSHLDLVSCRNLLIYLNRTAQNRVLEVLHFALNPSAYLLLGASESIDGVSDLFSVVDKQHHLFRSRPVPTRAFPVPEVTVRVPLVQLTEGEKNTEEKRAIERLSYVDLHQRLLEQYGPPSVIVNEEYDVVHLSDRAGRYLQVGGGEPSHNLLSLVRPELRLELRAALYQAIHDRINVVARSLKVNTDDGLRIINIIVRPVLRGEDVTRGLILVLFEEVEDGSAESTEGLAVSQEPITTRLEGELVQAKAQLRATVEQYEIQQEELRASNEELQAMNEELRSAAEELETSKEELQSVNEELTTVNQELKIKIEELSQANNNFQNLMDSTNIGTIFIDRGFKVRGFTPSARETFNLIPTDVGRPLMDITNRLNYENLQADMNLVLTKLQTLEREVITPDDRYYIMRLTPYRTLDDKIDGLVITLVNVTERARAEQLLRDTERRAQEDLQALTTLQSVSTRLGELADPTGMMDITLNAAISLGNANKGNIQLMTPDGRLEIAAQMGFRKRFLDFFGSLSPDSDSACAQARDTRERVIVENVRTSDIFKDKESLDVMLESEAYACISTPLITREKRLVGMLNIHYSEPHVPENRVLIRLDVLARQAADFIENNQTLDALKATQDELERKVIERTQELANANESLKKEVTERRDSDKSRLELLAQLVTTQEDERRRFALDLHDQLGQQLTALRLKLESLKEKTEKPKVRETISDLERIVRQLDSDVDFLAWQMRPVALDDLGLSAALSNYVKQWSDHYEIKAEFRAGDFEKLRMEPRTITNLYRIAQEALNNCAKHSKCSRVSVLLEHRDGRAVLIVEDNGVGFNPHDRAEADGRWGLIGMHERTALLGGTIEIESAPKKGTTIFVRAPLKLGGGASGPY
ncbi:MAG TPA: chemotaxis protein CheB [Pyrinomonadaceae bacterium]|nr:chemotaxis protein CheB [Pyrinomonadaceae bacterium]